MEAGKVKNIKDPEDCWVRWTGDFTSASGYSEGVRAMMKGFFENGFKLKITPRTYGSQIRMKKDISEIYEYYRNAEPGKRFITLQTMPPVSFFYDTESYFNIGRTADESSGIPEEWVFQCNRMDRIWVPSTFNRSTFIESGVAAEKVSVVPDAIDPDLYDTGTTPLDIEGKRSFNFLSIFDWKLKKGWDVLFEGFISEFSGSEDVSLVVRTFSFLGAGMKDIKDSIGNILERKAPGKKSNPPKIILIEKMLDQDEMSGLYRACDCFVLPTRGEGWGRPFMEAMAMGLPAIGTKWGGHLDFMNDNNSYLIDYNIVNVPPAGVLEMPAFRNKKWAEPSVEHLRSLMRHVYENRDEARAKGLKSHDFIIGSFNSRAVAGKIIQGLEEIKDWDKKKFRILVEQKQKEDFIRCWNKEGAPGEMMDNPYFDIGFFTGPGKQDTEECLPAGESRFNLQVNEYHDFKAPPDCHTILLLDNQSALLSGISSEETLKNVFHEETRKLLYLMYNVDDIWVTSRSALVRLAGAGIPQEDIFFLPGDAYRDMGNDPAAGIKKRLVLIKRRPIKKRLEENYLTPLKKLPGLVRDAARESLLAFIDCDNTGDIRKLVKGFVDKFGGRSDISLIVSTNPGKAKAVFSQIEKIISQEKSLRNRTGDIPDIVIFDEVLGRDGVIRLVNQADCFIPVESSMNNMFTASAVRLKKKIAGVDGGNDLLQPGSPLEFNAKLWPGPPGIKEGGSIER